MDKTKDYARVTTILNAVGLTDFSSIPERDRQFYMDRGTANHLAWEMQELGTADDFIFDPVVEEFRPAHKKFLEETGFKALPGGIEMVVSNDTLRIKGRLDRFGMMNGRKCVIDFKTNSLRPEVAIQTALYTLCLPDHFFEIDRYAVAFTKTGKYLLLKCPERKDKDIALAAVTLYWWKKSNGKLEA